MNMQIGNMIKWGRKAKGLTQAQLANKIGLDIPQFIYCIEAGKSHVPYEMLGKLIVILNLDESKIKNILTKQYNLKVKNGIEVGKAKAN